MNIIIFLIILLVLVIVHELGHFLSAKKFGVRVDEFGLGWPPKIFGFKRGETEYTINALPIGAFVKIFGENPDEESIDGPDNARALISKPRWQQAVILFAGIFANFMLAWILFSIGLMSGLPTSVGSGEASNYPVQDVHLVVVSVLKDSPAETAGLHSGDKIISIKSGDKSTTEVNPEIIKSFVVEGKEVEIGYMRGDDPTLNSVKITPKNDSEKYSIGIAMDQIGIAKLPILASFWEGMKLDVNITKGTVVGLYRLIVDGLRGQGSFASVTGPVGLVGIVGNAYQFGFAYLISFAGLISVNLAIINLLPFPALDGGRLFFLLIEKIKGSRINTKFANAANSIGFAILILLMLAVTYHDIVKLF